MKKLIITVIALIALVSFSACKQMPESENNMQGSSSENSVSYHNDNDTLITNSENEQEPSTIYMVDSMFQSFDAAQLEEIADLIITAGFDGTTSTFTVDENAGIYRSDYAYTQQFVAPTVTTKAMHRKL